MSTTVFDRALAHTLGIEGDFSNHVSDSGGETRYGVTKAVARAFGYAGDMRDLPLALAKRIYMEQYWIPVKGDAIAVLSEKLAIEIFDSAVNCGVPTASRWLQRCLNVLNRQGKDYADVEVDGRIGRMTTTALTTYLSRRGSTGEVVLLRLMNCLQGAFYVDLAERRSKDEDFMFGWARTRVEI